MDVTGEWRLMRCRAINELALPIQTVTAGMLEELDITAPVPLLNGAKPLVLIGLDNAHNYSGNAASY